ncbi:hypothetical protein X798_03616, partial [Onchocerca flexuosa]
RRRPKKWAQERTPESDVYTGLEKSDRELPPSNVINDNTKRRKLRFVFIKYKYHAEMKHFRSLESDNPYRRVYGVNLLIRWK